MLSAWSELVTVNFRQNKIYFIVITLLCSKKKNQQQAATFINQYAAVFTWKYEQFNDLSISQIGCSMERCPLLIVLKDFQIKHTMHNLNHQSIPDPSSPNTIYKLYTCRPQEIGDWVHEGQKVHHPVTRSFQFAPSLYLDPTLPPLPLLQNMRAQSAEWSYKQKSRDHSGSEPVLLTPWRRSMMMVALLQPRMRKTIGVECKEMCPTNKVKEMIMDKYRVWGQVKVIWKFCSEMFMCPALVDSFMKWRKEGAARRHSKSIDQSMHRSIVAWASVYQLLLFKVPYIHRAALRANKTVLYT